MKLTRYEIEFMGEPQGIGFIQGLKDIGIEEKQTDKLIEEFDRHLKFPDYIKFKCKSGEYIASFFTEAGIDKFKESIDHIIQYVKESGTGFDIIETILHNPKKEDVVYQDEYQMLIHIPRNI